MAACCEMACVLFDVHTDIHVVVVSHACPLTVILVEVKELQKGELAKGK